MFGYSIAEILVVGIPALAFILLFYSWHRCDVAFEKVLENNRKEWDEIRAIHDRHKEKL